MSAASESNLPAARYYFKMNQKIFQNNNSVFQTFCHKYTILSNLSIRFIEPGVLVIDPTLSLYY